MPSSSLHCTTPMPNKPLAFAIAIAALLMGCVRFGMLMQKSQIEVKSPGAEYPFWLMPRAEAAPLVDKGQDRVPASASTQLQAFLSSRAALRTNSPPLNHTTGNFVVIYRCPQYFGLLPVQIVAGSLRSYTVECDRS